MRITAILFLLTLWPAGVSADVAAKPVKSVHLPVIKLFTDKKDCDYTNPYPPDE